MPRYVAILGLAVASLFTLTAASATGSGSAVLPVDVASVQRRALLGGDDEEGGAFSSASSGGLEKRRRHRHRKHHSHHKKKKTKKHHHSSKPKPKPKPSHSGNSLSSPSVTHTGDATCRSPLLARSADGPDRGEGQTLTSGSALAVTTTPTAT